MQILKETKPKAKKQHICMFCNGIIEVGEKYNRQTIVADGDLYDFIYHSHCGELATMLDMYDDCYDEGINDNDFENYLQDYVYDKHKGEKEWEDVKPSVLAKMIYEELKSKEEAK